MFAVMGKPSVLGEYQSVALNIGLWLHLFINEPLQVWLPKRLSEVGWVKFAWARSDLGEDVVLDIR